MRLPDAVVEKLQGFLGAAWEGIVLAEIARRAVLDAPDPNRPRREWDGHCPECGSDDRRTIGNLTVGPEVTRGDIRLPVVRPLADGTSGKIVLCLGCGHRWIE